MAPLLVFIFSIMICRGYNLLIDYTYEMMVFCFMADEEMFQSSQRFAEPPMTEFFNQYGTESERAYLNNIQTVNRQKRSTKAKKTKKQDKEGKKVGEGEEEDDNSSEEEMDEEEKEKERADHIKKLMEKKRKEQAEIELERE
jgi:hypothetical protein